MPIDAIQSQVTVFSSKPSAKSRPFEEVDKLIPAERRANNNASEVRGEVIQEKQANPAETIPDDGRGRVGRFVDIYA